MRSIGSVHAPTVGVAPWGDLGDASSGAGHRRREGSPSRAPRRHPSPGSITTRGGRRARLTPSRRRWQHPTWGVHERHRRSPRALTMAGPEAPSTCRVGGSARPRRSSRSRAAGSQGRRCQRVAGSLLGGARARTKPRGAAQTELPGSSHRRSRTPTWGTSKRMRPPKLPCFWRERSNALPPRPRMTTRDW